MVTNAYKSKLIQLSAANICGCNNLWQDSTYMTLIVIDKVIVEI